MATRYFLDSASPRRSRKAVVGSNGRRVTRNWKTDDLQPSDLGVQLVIDYTKCTSEPTEVQKSSARAALNDMYADAMKELGGKDDPLPKPNDIVTATNVRNQESISGIVEVATSDHIKLRVLGKTGFKSISVPTSHYSFETFPGAQGNEGLILASEELVESWLIPLLTSAEALETVYWRQSLHEAFYEKGRGQKLSHTIFARLYEIAPNRCMRLLARAFDEHPSPEVFEDHFKAISHNDCPLEFLIDLIQGMIWTRCSHIPADAIRQIPPEHPFLLQIAENSGVDRQARIIALEHAGSNGTRVHRAFAFGPDTVMAKRALKTTADQDLLKEVALTHPHPTRRGEAAARLTDQDTLATIALNEQEEEDVRLAAIGRVQDTTVRATIVQSTAPETLRVAAASSLGEHADQLLQTWMNGTLTFSQPALLIQECTNLKLLRRLLRTKKFAEQSGVSDAVYAALARRFPEECLDILRGIAAGEKRIQPLLAHLKESDRSRDPLIGVCFDNELLLKIALANLDTPLGLRAAKRVQDEEARLNLILQSKHPYNAMQIAYTLKSEALLRRALLESPHALGDTVRALRSCDTDLYVIAKQALNEDNRRQAAGYLEDPELRERLGLH